MTIDELKIVNFGRFTEVTLTFDPYMTVFVGNNGAGKSSLLQALAIALSWFVARVRTEKGSGSPISETHIKNKRPFAQIDIKVIKNDEHTDNSDAEKKDIFFAWTLVKARSGRKTEKNSDLTDISRLADYYRDELTRNDLTSLPLIAFYPAERVVLDIPLKIKGKHSFQQFDGYDNSLTQGVDFRRFFEWFREREDAENETGISTDLLAKLEHHFGQGNDLSKKLAELYASSRDRQLTAVRQAISAFIPAFQNLRVRRKPRLQMVVDKAGETLDVNQLSQGEKSLMALVGDIARRLAMMNPALENPLTGEGIVLIDEIDLHLHPRWQRSLIERLRNTFPRCQFILTTHSPLVISDSKDITCYLLEDDNIRKTEKLYGLDANQVLLEVMDTDIRNAEIHSQLNKLLDHVQDGEIEQARQQLHALYQVLPEDHIELAKASLLLRKLELRHAQNR